MGQKQSFWIYWNILSLIFTEFVLCNENLLFAVFLYKSHILGSFCCKMLSVNQISEFSNQLFLQNKSMKQPFLHVDTNSDKLKVDLTTFGWVWSNMDMPFSSWDSKICCILRINLWVEFVFWMLIVAK